MEIPRAFKGGRLKEIGNIDFSEGEMKRFICYCARCGKKVLWNRNEIIEIVRHLKEKHLLSYLEEELEQTLLSRIKRGISKIGNKRIKIQLIDKYNFGSKSYYN